VSDPFVVDMNNKISLNQQYNKPLQTLLWQQTNDNSLQNKNKIKWQFFFQTLLHFKDEQTHWYKSYYKFYYFYYVQLHIIYLFLWIAAS
jgi:hypothetical protein